MKIPLKIVLLITLVSSCFSSPALSKNQPQFTMVQLTDIHYTSSPPQTSSLSWKDHIHLFGYKLHNLNLCKCSQIVENTIRHINQKIKPALVVITGDIVNTGNDKEGMTQAKDILDKLNCPYYPLIGDHDLNSGQDKKRNYKDIFGEINYSFNYRGWHIIMLGIYPDDDDLDWLKDDLDKNIDTPTILCMHRMLVASRLMKKLSRKYYCPELISHKAHSIINILNNHGRVVVVLSGHSHTNYQTRKNKIIYLSTAGLIELPYQFRIIKVYKNRISTSLITARPLKER